MKLTEFGSRGGRASKILLCRSATGDTGPSNEVNKPTKRKKKEKRDEESVVDGQRPAKINKRKSSTDSTVPELDEAGQANADLVHVSNPRSKGRSVKAVLTVVEDNQFFTMEAEGVDSEFPESPLESDGEQELEVSFKNSSQESGRNNNAMPEVESDSDQSNSGDDQVESDDPVDRYDEEAAGCQNADSESEQGNEELKQEDIEAMRKVQKLMAKEGFKESVNFLKAHIRGNKQSEQRNDHLNQPGTSGMGDRQKEK